MAQVVERLPSKCRALSSYPNTANKQPAGFPVQSQKEAMRENASGFRTQQSLLYPGLW
jgi:hypothetical protein